MSITLSAEKKSAPSAQNKYKERKLNLKTKERKQPKGNLCRSCGIIHKGGRLSFGKNNKKNKTMGHSVTLGGERLGSGNRQKIQLHGYERSTHDHSYIWKSTTAVGTLVPFLCKIGLPGDTFDITLNCEVMTHPTIGPLFGSMKVQLDMFQCPIRLYQGQLHNNKLGIGLNMANIKLPQYRLTSYPFDPTDPNVDIDNAQINPSCIIKYLGQAGLVRVTNPTGTPYQADYHATAFIAYWDTYKQYYSNKMEEIGSVIHTERATLVTTVTSINMINGVALTVIPQAPTIGSVQALGGNTKFTIVYAGSTPILSQLILNTSSGYLSLEQLGTQISDTGTVITIQYNGNYGAVTAINWNYIANGELPILPIRVQTFPLANIDIMREEILAAANTGATPFVINGLGNVANIPPYSYITFDDPIGGFNNLQNTQEGLALKTYQSDIFNNWLNTDYIDGPTGINEITAIDTTGGSFTVDALRLATKVNNMLNRIAVSGGTYDDWLDAVYDHDRFTRSESPIYHGGLIKELVFQQVISNSESGEQPLGTLAGRGTLGKKHKGGRIRIKVDEPSIILGIFSITPRLDYSQGNAWHTNLKTLDDLHKPGLDGIGFQELNTFQMAWWDSQVNDFGVVTNKSAGKQPAWINYKTDYNKTFGNFAIKTNEMFMTLNRRWEYDVTVDGIKDLTTYIDPEKFNHIFAQKSLDAMNYWVQIAVDMEIRGKISASDMPNL